jgi:hypothetical protein
MHDILLTKRNIWFFDWIVLLPLPVSVLGEFLKAGEGFAVC